jgi:hypothetical protein
MVAINFLQASDFTGGINFRADQFQLAPNESPGMVNVDIDPRGGIFSRAGYQTKHSSPISFSGEWNPKGLYDLRGTTPNIMLTTGYQTTGSYNGRVYKSIGGNFTTLDSGAATPLNVISTNGASFTTWNLTLYIALGSGATNMYKWATGDTYATSLLASGPTWQPYAQPTGGYMPRAELCVAHANKMFVANTYEDGVAYPNRLRWSHENLPEDWYQDDYIDINAGGEGIRGIVIVDGQLLIFKQKAIYLLMGYDADSFQLVEMSTNLGIDYPQQATYGSGGVYFFDFPNGLYFYNRNGITDIFERIRPIIINNEINTTVLDDITLSFINNRLWVSMPYQDEAIGSPPAYSSVNFIFDSTIGPNGAYTMYQSAPALSDDATPVEIPGFGLLSGTEWRDGNDTAWFLMINPDGDYPYVFSVDDYEYTSDDYLVGATPSLTGKFKSSYTTAWFDDGRYVQLKSFLRPYFVMKEVDAPTAVLLKIYKDFNESTVKGGIRTIDLNPTVSGGVYGTGVYGTAIYGTDTAGASIKRKGISPLGRAYAIQLEFDGPDAATDSALSPGRKWGINSIAYKYKRRKIRGT